MKPKTIGADRRAKPMVFPLAGSVAHAMRRCCNRIDISGLLILFVLVAVGCRGAQLGEAMLEHDFRTDPLKSGWELLQMGGVSKPAEGAWVSDLQDANAFSLRIGQAKLQSPEFPSEPHQYYKLTFQSKADRSGYWAAMFYDAEGNLLTADHNSNLFRSDDWIDNEFYFQGKADGVSAKLWFYPSSPREEGTIYIRKVRLEKAAGEQVLEWADRLYATLPPVDYGPPPDRWRFIPRSMQKLQNGEKLRIVILGDSIGNDTGNSPVDKLIERKYPGSTVELITSVRGGTGCPYYQERNRVDDFVVRYNPDLVMIIAISHRYDLDAIKSVVSQIRKKCEAEIIVTTGPISQEVQMVRSLKKSRKLSQEKAKDFRMTFLESTAKFSAEEKLEFIPLRRMWNDYMAKATRQHDVKWFMRDSTHANVRGRQVVARMLEKYFAPKR